MHRMLHILSQSFMDFFVQRYYIRCSALTYTTLLGCVPILSVIVAVLSKLPVIGAQLPRLQNFVFHNFLPEQGEKLVDYIEKFSYQARTLPWSQFVFLIIVSIFLVVSVERTVNVILGRQEKHAWRDFLRSFVMIILMMLFMAFSFVFSGYILSLPFLSHIPFIVFLDNYSSWWLPFLSSFTGFSMVYFFVPNQSVPFRYALLGGFVASVLFEGMKWFFTGFVLSIPTYNAIYGTLAIIPIFMIWIYSFWCVFIYGALLVNKCKS